MPQKPEARDYDKEYKDYYGSEGHMTPEQRRHRQEKASRNHVRQEFMKDGKVHKGDGKDIDHKNGNPLDNNPGNLHVVSASTNRSKH
jgi:hypothetical protein